MYLGYNTNGMNQHELSDAVELLADLGYRGVAITIDHLALPPYATYGRQRLGRLRRLLDRLEMRSVIETGARFLLDPRRKHEPTLVSDDPAGRARRIDFYRYAVDCAAALGSDCVSLWSGTAAAGRAPAGTDRAPSGTDRAPSTDGPRCSAWSRPEAIARLAQGLRQVLDYAGQQHVSIAFEPEPGMLIDSIEAWEELVTQAELPELRLTLDVGHLHCQGEGDIESVLQRWASRLVNVHVEDMQAGVHQHLMFGEGQIDFPRVLRALGQAGYGGGLYVELSRHSHVGPDAARQAHEFLSAILQAGEPEFQKSEIQNAKSQTNSNCQNRQ
jgi:sugar phosphate isomerase/epimerase